MKIFGAGLAGLIAGYIFPKATIYEKNNKDFKSHQALLRFRTNKISEITGIKFKKVNVLKSIWVNGAEVQPSPRIVAMYSQKVTGKYENRSIMDISTKTRYIAPDNFHGLLIDDLRERIQFNFEVNESDYTKNLPIISTLPLSFNSKMLGYNFNTVNDIRNIYVSKYEIKSCDMYCTVYYPSNSIGVYRASITGNKLIIESISMELSNQELEIVIESLGISNSNITEELKNFKQTFGKLYSLNDDERRVQIYKMSHDHSVFSLGRFAIHKNILLDDVAKDIYVIKAMINDDAYGASIMGRV